MKWVLGILILVVVGGAGWWYRSTLLEMAAAVTGREVAEQRLSELEAVTASKDSLFDDLMETTSLITDVSHAVSALQAGRPELVLDPSGEKGRPLSVREARRVIFARIDSVRIRMTAMESRLNASLERMREYAGTQERMRAQLADYEQRINAMTALVERQEAQLAALDVDLRTLREENQRLQLERDEMTAAQTGLEEQITDLAERQNIVYWIAGRKQDLLRQGVVVERGGLIGIGKSIVPASAPPFEAFQAINRAQQTSLSLPTADKRYRIVSSHSPHWIAESDSDGKIRGTVTITNHEVFWEASVFLILVED